MEYTFAMGHSEDKNLVSFLTFDNEVRIALIDKISYRIVFTCCYPFQVT